MSKKQGRQIVKKAAVKKEKWKWINKAGSAEPFGEINNKQVNKLAELAERVLKKYSEKVIYLFKFTSWSSECNFSSGVSPLENQFLHFRHARNQISKLEAEAVFCISQYWQSCCKYPHRRTLSPTSLHHKQHRPEKCRDFCDSSKSREHFLLTVQRWEVGLLKCWDLDTEGVCDTCF